MKKRRDGEVEVEKSGMQERGGEGGTTALVSLTKAR
jgi:hypothetical protein